MKPITQAFPRADGDLVLNSGPRIISAQDYIRKAHAAFARDNLKLARECLRAALAFQPEDAELLLALGHVEFGLGHYETALERYTVVIEMSPHLVEAISSRALTLQLLHRSKEARVAAQRALDLAPSDLVALKVMARISIDTGHHDRARDFCRRLLNASPGDREALMFLDQCRFDMEAFLAEDSQARPAPSSDPGFHPWGPIDGPPPPPPLESVLVKFPGVKV